MRSSLHKLLAWLRRRWAVEPAEERIEGSGEVHLDPAYNGRYTAERRLRQLSKAQSEVLEGGDPDTERSGR